MISQHLTLNASHHNQRLDAVLAQLLPEFSRSQISHWIKTGAIQKNAKPCKPRDKALPGDNILFTPPLQDLSCDPLQAENIPLNIVYEDESILILNKPAGLVMHPGAGNPRSTLMQALLYHEPSLATLPRAGIVHRLDKDTTGLLVVAKTLAAHSHLIRQMQDRAIEREYLALVQGQVTAPGIIDTGFGRHPKNRLKMAVLPGGRQAVTQYHIEKQYPGLTLLRLRLLTGRTHQIRVHMTHINHPIIGDPLYGSKKGLSALLSTDTKTLLQHFPRQALHARTLVLPHPLTQEMISFEAPLPADFQQLLEGLEHADA